MSDDKPEATDECIDVSMMNGICCRAFLPPTVHWSDLVKVGSSVDRHCGYWRVG